RGRAEERHRGPVVVAQVGEEGGTAAALRRLHQCPRADRGFGQETPVIEEGAQPAGLLVDQGIAQALIDAGEGSAHELARIGDKLPIAEMQAADHAGAAADDVLKLLHWLEANALLSDDLLEVERFAECAAEVLPHGGGDALALLLRKLGIRELEIGERAVLPVKTGRDQPPGEAGGGGSGFERQRPASRLKGPESEIFQ